ncbi:TetR/AcrR family transcriptional regulator [Microbacterium sp.]|uniref:TetR/AcrR family transcriptional regulator n=1 Tax=Microbacterium sp. TaxID=51671 RepID=UPI00261AF819|nr:TetR/AcrR family transcriptional regulator [Microbacterium sp.]
MARDASRGVRPPTELTLTERARRSQLIAATIDLVAERGYAGASLAGIAQNAGITKAAVLYHFPSKAHLVRAAYEHVIDALVQEVAGAVESVEVGDGPAAYIRSMISHLHEHPHHTRMIIEAMTHDEGDGDSAERWRPLADIIAAAHPVRAADEGNAKNTAIIIGGAINAIVAERLQDPDYDTAAAAEQLVRMVERSTR